LKEVLTRHWPGETTGPTRPDGHWTPGCI